MKKPYTAPKITAYGGAAALTLGNFGFRLEFINFRLGLP